MGFRVLGFGFWVLGCGLWVYESSASRADSMFFRSTMSCQRWVRSASKAKQTLVALPSIPTGDSDEDETLTALHWIRGTDKSQ